MKTTTKTNLRTGQVAQRLGVGLAAVRALVARGTLPALRIGTQLRFTPEDVERLLVNARVNAGHERCVMITISASKSFESVPAGVYQPCIFKALEECETSKGKAYRWRFAIGRRPAEGQAGHGTERP